MVQGGGVGAENRVQSHSKNYFVLLGQPEEPQVKTKEGFKAAQILLASPSQEKEMKCALPAISCFTDKDFAPDTFRITWSTSFLIDFDN